MKIFLINLDNAKIRLRYQEKQMERLGLDFERWRATPINEIEQEFIQDFHKKWKWVWSPLDYYIALFYDHMQLWKKIIASGKPALILEDDVFFCPDIKEVLSHIEAGGFQGYINLEQSLSKRTISTNSQTLGYKDYHLIQSYRDKTGAAGYIADPEAASILLDASKKLFLPSDTFIQSPFIKMKRYIIEPSPLCQNKQFLGKTFYLQENFYQKMKMKKNKTAYKIRNIYEKCFFPKKTVKRAIKPHPSLLPHRF